MVKCLAKLFFLKITYKEKLGQYYLSMWNIWILRICCKFILYEYHSVLRVDWNYIVINIKLTLLFLDLTIMNSQVRVWADPGRVFQILSWQVILRRITWGLVLRNLGRWLQRMTYMSSTRSVWCLVTVTDPILWYIMLRTFFNFSFCSFSYFQYHGTLF